MSQAAISLHSLCVYAGNGGKNDSSFARLIKTDVETLTLLAHTLMHRNTHAHTLYHQQYILLIKKSLLIWPTKYTTKCDLAFD